MKAQNEIVSRDTLLNQIIPDPNQPREYFNQQKIDELAASIESVGLVSPILIRPHNDGFMIVHGERRFRAFKQLGRETIPAMIQPMTEEEARRIALIENIQRENLSPIEEARTYKKFLVNCTQDQLANELGINRTVIAQKLRLLKMPDALIYLLDKGALSEGHCRVLMKLKKFYCGVTEELSFNNLSIETITNDDLSYWFLILRPEEHLFGTMFSSELFPGAMRSMLKNMANESEHSVYTRVSSWFAIQTAISGMSVVDTSHVIDNFIERVNSNILYLRGINKTPPKQYKTAIDRVNYAHWWGAKTDLKHGGLHNVPDDMYFNAFEILKNGSYAYPSKIQYDASVQLKNDIVDVNTWVSGHQEQ